MSTASIQFKSLQPHSATLAVQGAIDTNLATELIHCLQVLREDFRYQDIVLEIESPGGQLLGLKAIERELEACRKAGVRLSTFTRYRAASAAAMLLTWGQLGHRMVAPSASVLFHHARIAGDANSGITAHSAQEVQAQLEQCDQQMLHSLVQRLQDLCGGPARFITLVSRRARAMLTHFNDLIPHVQLVAPTTQEARAGAKSVCTKLRTLAQLSPQQADAAVQKYELLLRKEFDRDSAQNLLLAYAMVLIDAVEGVSLDTYLEHASLVPAPKDAAASANAANDAASPRQRA